MFRCITALRRRLAQRPTPPIAVLATALFLANCGGATMFASGPDTYDGVWAGRMTFTLGVADCPRRAGVQTEIENGVIDGEARWGDEDGTISGVIGEDGTLRAGSVKMGRYDTADLAGSFDEREAAGTWKSRDCEGTWELRKVRGL